MTLRLSALMLSLLVALLAVGLLAAPLSADELIESEPPAGETLGEAPEAILLTFDEPLALEPGANSAAIIDAEGFRVDDGSAQISTYSARTLIVRLAHGLEPEGPLRVAYSVRFADGSERDASFAFTIEHGAAEHAVVEVAGEPRSSQSLVLWTVAILAGIALTATLLYFLRLASGNARSSLEPIDRTPFGS